MESKKKKISFDKFSVTVARVTGSPAAFFIAALVVVIWGISGPVFHFSDTWQLVINTGTTIITFLMVFVIQQAQNKDTMAIQLKLNELIAATRGASNKAMNIEDLTEDELAVLKKFYAKLSDISASDGKPGATHSLDDVQNESKPNGLTHPVAKQPISEKGDIHKRENKK